MKEFLDIQPHTMRHNRPFESRLASMMWAIIVFASGCGPMAVPLSSPTARTTPPSTFWGTGRTSLIQDLDGMNFYNCDIDKYPDYGIVTYSTKALPFTNSNERRLLESSLVQCREEYAVSYVREKLVTQDYRLTHKEQWVSPQLVSFHPRWIVVLIIDYPKTAEVSQRDKKQESIQQRSIAAEAAFKVGFVVEASQLFNEAIPIFEVAKDAKRFEHPVHVDYSKSSSSEWEEYEIIKRFEDSQRNPGEPASLLK